MNELTRRNEIQDMMDKKGLTAPRVTVESIAERIHSVEYVKHTLPTGGILRWCVINMVNGFSVTSKPSACCSPENDDEEIGKKVAFDNAYREIWQLEGYLLCEKLAEVPHAA